MKNELEPYNLLSGTFHYTPVVVIGGDSNIFVFNNGHVLENSLLG